MDLLTPFQYGKLSPRSIRLMYLDPAGEDTELCCRLITTKIKSAPSYEAVSYVWGSKRNKTTIFITTPSGVQQLSITQTLLLAYDDFDGSQ
jgi:hypothetical protein